MEGAEADQKTTFKMAAADSTSTSSGFFEGEKFFVFLRTAPTVVMFKICR
jgi:hypothetical protein